MNAVVVAALISAAITAAAMWVGRRKMTAEVEQIAVNTSLSLVTALREELDRAMVRITALERRVSWEQQWSSWSRSRIRQLIEALEGSGTPVPPPSTPEPVWPAEQGEQT